MTNTLSLREWIIKLGSDEVAKLLRVNRSAVTHWMRGANLPSDKLKQKIKLYSCGAVTYSEMIDTHFENLKKKNKT